MKKKWAHISSDEAVVSSMCDALNVSRVVGEILVDRGIDTYDKAFRFFRPNLDMLHDPDRMFGMTKACDRIIHALQNKEKILLYGDYDVDGTTCVATMFSFLNSMTPHLDYYIPDRYNEGYGISEKGVLYAKEHGIGLVIAMDCGIRANKEIGLAKSMDIDFIVCDHHMPGDELPEAIAILDPKQSTCDYPYQELSGCGVVFKLIQGLAGRLNIELEAIQDLLEFVAISNACDIVPITGENRVLTYFGLKSLNQTKRIGLRALIKESSKNPPLEIGDLVFGIGPMINAVGRLSDAKHAVTLLLATDEAFAYENARLLAEKNQERKIVDRSILAEAKQLFSENGQSESKRSIVLHQEHWHKGVIGIAASRMVESFYKPTVIFTTSNDKFVGSARSVSGFNIYNAIKDCEDLLENWGGHAFAAGITLHPDNFPAFQQKFEEMVAEMIQPEHLVPEIAVSAELELNEITPKFNRILKQMAPFGPRNRRPVFVTKGVVDSGSSKIVKEDHLKLSVRGKCGSQFDAIAFGMAHFYPEIKSKPFNLCYAVEENNWRGMNTLQLVVKDIQFDKS